MQNSFPEGRPYRKEQRALIYFQMANFSFPLSEAQGELSLVFTVRTCRSLGGKTHKSVEASESPLPGLSTLNLQQLTNYSLGFPTPALVPVEVSALVSCDSLSPHVCLFNFWSRNLLRDLNSLMALRAVVGFQVV